MSATLVNAAARFGASWLPRERTRCRRRGESAGDTGGGPVWRGDGSALGEPVLTPWSVAAGAGGKVGTRHSKQQVRPSRGVGPAAASGASDEQQQDASAREQRWSDNGSGSAPAGAGSEAAHVHLRKVPSSRRWPSLHPHTAAATPSSPTTGRYEIDYTTPGGPGLRQALRELGGQARHATELQAPVESVFERSGGFVYIRNFFSPRDFEMLLDECEALKAEVGAERRACARQRLGMMVPQDHLVHSAFMNERVAERLSGLVGQMLQPADVPVEYRVYPIGSCMEWHKDVALYTQPQYELVFTLSNTSDSQTQWQDAHGQRRGGWTEPNSIIVVRAESVVHRVTPITVGERGIVKFVYTTTLEKTADYYDNLLTYS